MNEHRIAVGICCTGLDHVASNTGAREKLATLLGKLVGAHVLDVDWAWHV